MADNPFVKFEQRFGLKPTSKNPATKGAHTKTSHHYKRAPWGGPQAWDYGTSRNSKLRLRIAGTYLAAMAKAGKKYRWRNIEECFGPFPFYVKKGVVYKGQFPGHDDHLHVAFSK